MYVEHTFLKNEKSYTPNPSREIQPLKPHRPYFATICATRWCTPR